MSLPAAPERSSDDPGSVLRDAAAGGPVTLVGLAPLTNVAALAGAATDVVLVAGELRTEEPPELNAGHDPLATTRVLAGVRAPTLYVADVFEQVSVTPADVARLRSAPGPAARLAGDLLAVRRGHLVGDAGALVLLTHPHLFRVEPHRMGQVGRHLTRTEDGRLLDVVVDADASAVATTYVEILLAH